MFVNFEKLKNIIIQKKIELLLKDGTFKTTKNKRNPASLNLLKSGLTNEKNLNILEIGTSYGFSSIDIYKFFTKESFKVKLFAFEKNLYLNFRRSIFNIFFIYDSEYLVAIYIELLKSFFLMNPKRRNLILKIASILIQFLWKIHFHSKGYLKSNKKFKLITSKINNYPIKITDNLRDLETNKNILICFNVLNRGYYSKFEANNYLSEFCSFLKDGALVVIGRNHGKKESSSLYRYKKSRNKLFLLHNINKGWDYEEKEISLIKSYF